MNFEHEIELANGWVLSVCGDVCYEREEILDWNANLIRYGDRHIDDVSYEDFRLIRDKKVIILPKDKALKISGVKEEITNRLEEE